MKISLRIIDSIKNRLGADFPVLYRLGVEDVLPDGLSLDEGVSAAKMLFEMGVDIMDVSMGLGFTLRWLDTQDGFGILVPQAVAVGRAAGFPVIGVGDVNTPEEADEIIRSGKVDLVAVGRALRREPRWASIAIDSLIDP
jgi:2,4-dienoyl-CoA reductase-like NADH-dependent reductase (Old Yellow Enzyme family)